MTTLDAGDVEGRVVTLDAGDVEDSEITPFCNRLSDSTCSGYRPISSGYLGVQHECCRFLEGW